MIADDDAHESARSRDYKFSCCGLLLSIGIFGICCALAAFWFWAFFNRDESKPIAMLSAILFTAGALLISLIILDFCLLAYEDIRRRKNDLLEPDSVVDFCNRARD